MRGVFAWALAAFLVLPGCGGSLPGGAGVEAYQFDAARVPVGVVYHYIKSNLDGSTPERVSLYMSDQETLEAYKWREPTPQSASYVKATMDWARLSATRLESRKRTKTGEQTGAIAEYAPVTKSLSIEFADQSRQTIMIDRLPFHFYQFDLASLNMAFRHLRDPKQPFSVGLANPTFAATGAALQYRGAVTITYEADEKHNEFPCRKYRIDGEGLKNRGGTIWVERNEGHVIDVEIAEPNHPDWTTFKLKFVGRETMKPDQWQAFMKSRFDGV